MSQKLSVNNFEWIKDTSEFNEGFTKNYIEEGDKRYFVEVDVQHIKKLYEFHNNLPLVANLYDKSEYVIHMKNLKQALNHGLVLKKKFIEWLNLIKMLG